MPNEDPANCATTRKSVLAFAPPTTDGSSSSCSIHHVCQMSHIVTSKSVQKRGLLALRVTIIFWNTFVPDDGLVPHLRNWNMQDNLGGAKRGNPHQNSGLVKMYNFRPSCRFWPFWQKKKTFKAARKMVGDQNKCPQSKVKPRRSRLARGGWGCRPLCWGRRRRSACGPSAPARCPAAP